MGAERKSFSAAVAGDLLESEERVLRYGENPHQWGLVARRSDATGLAGAYQHQGKGLSYNNLGDATGAWRLVWDLPSAGVAIIKHANPCGVGLADDMTDAFRIARATDPVSAFGGVIVANRKVDAAFAEVVARAIRRSRRCAGLRRRCSRDLRQEEEPQGPPGGTGRRRRAP